MSALAERFFERALNAIKIRDYDRANGLLVETIKLIPDMAEAWICRGNTLHAQGRPFDALLHFDRAIAIREDLYDAWNGRGLCFADIGMWESAEQSFRRSIEIKDAVEPHINLANTFCTVMRLRDAAEEYRAAIALDPGCLDAHVNLGVTLLGLGEWKEGFKEYEVRWENTPMAPRAFRDHVKWTGQDLTGKRIVLYPEQGYGDEILALRFANTLAKRYPDADIVVQPRTPMQRLCYEGFEVENNVHNWLVGDDEPRADFSSPLLDVPMYLGLRIGDIDLARYISAQAKNDVWRRRIASRPRGLSVGLCWSAGSHFGMPGSAQKMKSIPLEWLKSLAMDGVNLISLQKGGGNFGAVRLFLPITDWMEECHDFSDTAALIEALDLVITVDTAVAHLAGALGKPVWNFVRYSGYWPWLAPDVVGDPEKSIWYPSMKLLRQPSLANWDEPIQRATEWLKAEVGKRNENGSSQT